MSTTASSSTPSTSRQTKISVWLPIPAFIGTSLALAIPLFMLHRQRVGKNTLRTSLKFSQTPPPPPRRSSTISSTLTPLRGSSSTPASVLPSTSKTISEPSDGSSSPGMPELLSAISQVNQSTALLAAKAFLIATGLVAVGGVTFTWAVKETLGVADAKEFGQKMRTMLQTTVPGLRSRLYRPPETDDEFYEVQLNISSTIEEEWSWAEAEERLKKAYEKGGITVWAHTALKELEAEARVERNKRDREQEVASTAGQKDLSLN